MENQQEKSWVVTVQKTHDSTPVDVAAFDTKKDANNHALKLWNDDVFKVTTEYK